MIFPFFRFELKIANMFMVTSFKLIALAAYIITYSKYNADIIEVDNALNLATNIYYGALFNSFPTSGDINHSPEETTDPAAFATITLPKPGSKAITNVQGRKYPQSTAFHNIKYAKSPTGNLR